MSSDAKEHKAIVREFLKKEPTWVIGKTDDIKTVYELGEQIGERGTYGFALRSKHKATGEQRAVKVLPKEDWSKIDYNCVRKEIKVLKSVDHVNIIKVFEIFEDADHVYIAMELCEGGELFEKMQNNTKSVKFSEKQAAHVTKQVIEGLHHLHKKNVAHCDLKPDNFLFLTKDLASPLKIIDMGMAQIMKPGGYLSETIGTPYFIAPEVLQGSYTEKCDIWSVGVILFMLVFGYPPYPCDDIESPDMATQRETAFTNTVQPGTGPFFPSSTTVSAELRDLITQCLRPTFTERPSADKLLQHPWFEEAAHMPDVTPPEVKEEVMGPPKPKDKTQKSKDKAGKGTNKGSKKEGKSKDKGPKDDLKKKKDKDVTPEVKEEVLKERSKSKDAKDKEKKNEKGTNKGKKDKGTKEPIQSTDKEKSKDKASKDENKDAKQDQAPKDELKSKDKAVKDEPKDEKEKKDKVSKDEANKGTNKGKKDKSAKEKDKDDPKKKKPTNKALARRASEIKGAEAPKSKSETAKLEPSKKKGTLGFKMADAYDESEGGLVVTELVAGMPAEVAGLAVGDVVVRVNGCEVKSLEAFTDVVKKLKPGKGFSLNVKRSGQVTRIQVEVPE